MKVYVITKGEYSDYSIYGVVLDEKRAEALAKYIGDDFNCGMVEEYDTDQFSPLFDGKRPYEVNYRIDGSVRDCHMMTFDLYAFESKIRKYVNGYLVYVWATDEKHAVKIANDKLAEYKYRRAMEE